MVDKKNVARAGKAPVKSSARKGEAKKVEPKKKYSNPFSFTDPMQSKFINSLMKNGKKTVAQRILKDVFDEMNRRGEDDPMKTFEKAIDNCTPSMEVKPKRIGGAVYQIPLPATEKRQKTLPTRWILAAARKKKGQPMYRRLAAELIDASKEAGTAFNQKEEVHRMAQANKAFAHLARY